MYNYIERYKSAHETVVVAAAAADDDDDKQAGWHSHKSTAAVYVAAGLTYGSHCDR